MQNYPEQTFPVNRPDSYSFISAPAAVFLLLLWGLSGLMLNLPLAAEFTLLQKMLLLLPGLAVSLLFVLINPQNGFSVWALGLTFLITQTGFQANVGPVRSSALELVLLILLVLLAFMRRQTYSFGRQSIRLPGQKILISFCVFSFIILLVSLFSGYSFTNAIWQFKGFLLYPFMAILLLAGISNQSILRWVIVLASAWYVMIAGRGLLQFIQGQATVAEGIIFRSQAEYAPENLFGITLAVMAILVLGVTMDSRFWNIRIGGLMVTGWLVLGSLTSVSRSALAALVIGVAVLFLLRGSRRGYVIAAFILLTGVLLYLPSGVSSRLFQIADSSTETRLYYLESAFEALKVYGLTGAGWGRWFLFEPGLGLLPVKGIPWYHNDFLNLWVQVGIFGLLLYLAFWGAIFRRGYIWVRRYGYSQLAPYVRGSFAGLVGLMVGAMFEHVLWRPDMAGLVGWMLGILVVSMNLQVQNQERNPGEYPTPVY